MPELDRMTIQFKHLTLRCFDELTATTQLDLKEACPRHTEDWRLRLTYSLFMRCYFSMYRSCLNNDATLDKIFKLVDVDLDKPDGLKEIKSLVSKIEQLDANERYALVSMMSPKVSQENMHLDLYTPTSGKLQQAVTILKELIEGKNTPKAPRGRKPFRSSMEEECRAICLAWVSLGGDLTWNDDPKGRGNKRPAGGLASFVTVSLNQLDATGRLVMTDAEDLALEWVTFERQRARIRNAVKAYVRTSADAVRKELRARRSRFSPEIGFDLMNDMYNFAGLSAGGPHDEPKLSSPPPWRRQTGRRDFRGYAAFPRFVGLRGYSSLRQRRPYGRIGRFFRDPRRLHFD